MNDSYLHLLINHFPITIIPLGFVIFLIGFFKTNKILLMTSFGIFIFAVVAARMSMFTGEKAEKFIEHNAEKNQKINFTLDVVHQHEEASELFMYACYALGIFSLIGIYFNRKEHSKKNWTNVIIGVIALVAMYLSYNVGRTGGEIFHHDAYENPMPAVN